MKASAQLGKRLARAVLDAIAALLGLYYSTKFAAVVRWLGLAPVPPSDRRGFIVIQIDGLSYPHLQEAMARGYAPYLQRLLRRGEFVVQPWKTGLPSTTPAVQAGIMFGHNDDIPAFRWYDKAAREAIACSSPSHTQAIQERLSREGRGILTGGSSLMNMFDGDASLSLFTLGAMNRQRFFESAQGLGFALLFVLNPFRSLKTLVLSLWEYLTELYQSTAARIRGRTPRPLKRTFPFLRVLCNVVFREVQTFAAMVDVYRGVPAIYTTYYGYDELAHQYGPLSKPALRALGAIDTRIRQIDMLRRHTPSCAHELFILSDHGIVSAMPFVREYHQTLGEFVRELVGSSVQLSEEAEREHPGIREARYLEEELQAIEANLRPPLAFLARRLRRTVGRRIAAYDGQDMVADPTRRTDLVIQSSGPLCHLYFGLSDRQMDLSQVMRFFPGLIKGLLTHPGIWLVIAREGDRVLVMSREGVLSLNGQEAETDGADPLAGLPDRDAAASQLERLARFQNAGDLILMGRYFPEQESVSCFEEQWACHGGLGGPQELAFMMMERHVGWDLSPVCQASDLYPLFSQRYTPHLAPENTVADREPQRCSSPCGTTRGT